MRIVIIEDEPPAARRLQQLIGQFQPQAQILAILDSVSGAVQWLRTQPPPDLMLVDIQLADGVSFDIFREVQTEAPVIFTTAYDQYTLEAFKLNSVDYLLKPVETEALQRALEKFQRHWRPRPLTADVVADMVRQLQTPAFKERFLVRSGNQIGYVRREDIAYFFADDGLVFAQLWEGRKHHIDYNLDQLSDLLPPRDFFRISRKVIVHIDSIEKIHAYFSGRLLLHLRPAADFKATVSRDRVNDFKFWLDR